MYPGNFLRAINRFQQFSRRFASFEVEKKSDHFIFKKFSKDVTQSTGKVNFKRNKKRFIQI